MHIFPYVKLYQINTILCVFDIDLASFNIYFLHMCTADNYNIIYL